MAWLKDCIKNVQNRMNQDVEQRKVELKVEETNRELSLYQQASEFPSDEKIDDMMEGYQDALDTFTLMEILIEHGLTTKEEYYERRNKLEEELRAEIKKQYMEDLPI